MAVPLLAPLAPFFPVIKVLALGSVKFIGIGIGAAVAPVTTVNFLVGLAAGTPLKYAAFKHKKGRLTPEQLELINNADQLIQDSIQNKEKHLSRKEAQEFLMEVLFTTISSMRDSIVSIPVRIAGMARAVTVFFKKIFGRKDQ